MIQLSNAKKGVLSFLLLPLLLLGFSITQVQAQAKKELTVYNHSALTTGSDSVLYVKSNPPVSSDCSFQLNKAMLKAFFYLGEDYKYGDAAFSANVKLTIRAYSTYSGTSGLIDTFFVNMSLDQDVPERLFAKAFTSTHASIARFTVSIDSYTSSALVQDSIRLKVFFEEDFGIDVSGVTVTNSSVTTVNPRTFTWTTSCNDAPDYQFQLLRLYNTNPAYTSETQIKAVVDWDEALSIETESSDTNLTINVAEGKGYYIWRVRPVGTYYPGGIADSRNWGSWSTATANGAILDITSAPADGFFYNQFDDSLNWIYNRSFSEGNKIREQITYANGLQQSKQTQVHLQSENNVLINATGYDYSGRPALTTMAAPYAIDSFSYHPGFIKVGSTLYSFAHFDEDTTYNTPKALTHGILSDYYSDSNADNTIPDGEDYPYSRSLFYMDGRVKEQGGPGETHRIKLLTDPANHTVKTYYSGVSTTELIRIFGDEAPAAGSMHKTMTSDADQVVSVNYLSKEGQTLATCLSIGSNETTLDTLPSQATSRFTVTDTLTGTVPHGLYGNKTVKQIAFATNTNVTFHYSIDAKEIELLCANYCSTCDYFIEFRLHTEDTTYYISHLVPAGSCNDTIGWDTTFARTFPPGSYIIEKIVTANNLDNSTVTANTSAITFLQGHLDSLETYITKQINDSLATVYDFLSRSSMDSLYTYLGVSTQVYNPDSVFADSSVYVNVGCDLVEIPIMACEDYDCSDSTPDFEAYFAARWGSPHADLLPNGKLSYLPDYAPGEFNVLVANMIGYTDDYGISPYSCQQLWNCWDQMVQSYDMKVSLDASSTQYELDLLDEFLSCTGRRFKGFSTTSGGATGYLNHAYAYFNYTVGNSAYCDSLLCPPGFTSTSPNNCSTVSWPQDSSSTMSNNNWEPFYNCINTIQALTPTNSQGEPYQADITCKCNWACEARYEGFVTSLITMYHNDSLYVEGDLYYLARDTTWGQEYSFSNTLLPGGFSNYIPMSEIECAATTLVENCKESCSLTIYYNPNNPAIIDSIGSTAEILAMQQSMTYHYDLALPSGGNCPSGYEAIYPPATQNGDTNFYKLWDRRYGGNQDDYLWAIEPASSGCGGYVLAGWTLSGDTLDVSDTLAGGKDYWIIKVNQEGEKMWNHSFGGSLTDELRAIKSTPDGGFIIGGYSISDSTGNKSDSARWNSYDYWVIKLDEDGNQEWDKTFGGSGVDYLQALLSTSDGGYLLGGYSNSPADGDKSEANYSSSNDYWVVKIDSAGIKEWDKRFGSSSDDKLFDMHEAGNDKYLLAGYSDGTANNDKSDATNGEYDYWVVMIEPTSAALGYYAKEWDQSYGGRDQDYLYSCERATDGDFVLAGVSISTTSSPSDKTQNPYNSSYDYWILKISPGGDTIRWNKTYGGDLAEGPQTERYCQVRQLNNGGYLLGGSSGSNISGDKSENSYEGIDYWVLKLDASGNKVWDKTLGGTLEDYFTAMSQDSEGNYWLAGHSLSGISGTKTQASHGGYDYWVIKGRDYCTHDTICFKWESISIVTDSNTVAFEPITCDSISGQAIYNSLELQAGLIVEAQLQAFKDKYTTTCANPDSIDDTFVMVYDLGLHHYTLYYYDRAGNRVRTVPPKGVVYPSTTRQQHPAHTLVTEYEYNSLKQLIRQKTPDGGETHFWYDYKGQQRFSRNAKQLAAANYSYIKYDNLGRIIETGESGNTYATFTDSVNSINFPPTGSERIYTVFTTNANLNYLDNTPQRYLQNRVSYTYTDDNVYTYFSYDPHGNVQWMIQDIPGLDKKYLYYEYDLVSKNVMKVRYNEGRADGFYHRYTYDADNRIKTAETSYDNYLWDRDGKYNYYKHGPLKRLEIGEDHIQGIDYVYTLQGWLKGINHPTLLAANDPGNDNNIKFASDAFGMVLGYHSGDFNRTSSPFNPSTASLISSQSGIDNLFKGNISSWTLQTDSITTNYAGQIGFKYRYDQLNRIKTEDYNAYASSSWSDPANSFDNTYIYDGNGNILNLNRKGNANNMDELSYNYSTGTNQLSHVDDAISSIYSTDIDDQVAGNYLYDVTGNLVKNVQEGIDTITWTVYGKVKEVIKTNGDKISFTYDAAGNRVMKKDDPAAAAPTVMFYAKDATGNSIAHYERTTSGSNYIYKIKERPIYGNERLGLFKTDVAVKTVDTTLLTNFPCFSCDVTLAPIDVQHLNNYFYRAIAKKEYEMKDHLGNVRATVSDRKYADSTANILGYMHYYAFGSELTGKNYSSNSYRYGFNGKEKDDEVSGSGNIYDYGFRIYDSRVARFLSVDPLTASFSSWSPYPFAMNQPIWSVDLDGLERSIIIRYHFMGIPLGGNMIFVPEGARIDNDNKKVLLIKLPWRERNNIQLSLLKSNVAKREFIQANRGNIVDESNMDFQEKPYEKGLIKDGLSVQEYKLNPIMEVPMPTDESGSKAIFDNLTNEQKKQLSDWAVVVNSGEVDGAKFIVEGHTSQSATKKYGDNTLSEQNNIDLSIKRAESGAQMLNEYFDVPMDKISTTGAGYGKPKNENDTYNENNQRVVIKGSF